MTAASGGIRLGLIGVGIERSRAPELHRLAGRLCGLPVTYELIPLASDRPDEFHDALAACCSRGYRGVNVTHPFKEQAAQAVAWTPETVRRLGAVNTVRFVDRAGTQGFNTDYSGFVRAFRSRFPGAVPGSVAIVGTGGAGRAIAFGLVDLGARTLRLFDQEAPRAERLAEALRAGSEVDVVLCTRVEEAVAGAQGLINATPLGMHRHPGTAIPEAAIGTQAWAFDAVYTPLETQFLRAAAQAGLAILSGYELFFYQGVDAFELFTGVRVDEDALRAALGRATPQP
jgi:quinate/shikimate dehydrogenase (NAD+)